MLKQNTQPILSCFISIKFWMYLHRRMSYFLKHNPFFDLNDHVIAPKTGQRTGTGSPDWNEPVPDRTGIRWPEFWPVPGWTGPELPGWFIGSVPFHYIPGRNRNEPERTWMERDGINGTIFFKLRKYNFFYFLSIN